MICRINIKFLHCFENIFKFNRQTKIFWNFGWIKLQWFATGVCVFCKPNYIHILNKQTFTNAPCIAVELWSRQKGSITAADDDRLYLPVSTTNYLWWCRVTDTAFTLPRQFIRRSGRWYIVDYILTHFFFFVQCEWYGLSWGGKAQGAELMFPRGETINIILYDTRAIKWRILLLAIN